MLNTSVKSIIILALIMSLRIFNLAMMLPIFTEYASHICHSNSLLTGISAGVYGLMQGMLQMPFGMLSDRIGRKPVILGGLILLLIGSIVCALSNNIIFLILGRALQGAGAIGSSILAYVSDVTNDNNRIKAMAFIGISIGFSFCASIIIGPILHSRVSLNQIFLFCTVTTILSIFLLTQTQEFARTSSKKPSFRAAVNSNILILAISVFFLHAILASLFSLIPILFNELWGCSQPLQGVLYCSFLVLSFLLIAPIAYIFKRNDGISYLIFNMAALISLTQLLLYRFYSANLLLFLLFSFFFVCFNFLESLLPSTISKISPPEAKGTAMGIYSSCQFLGIFIGSICGNTILHILSAKAVFLFCSFAAFLWLVSFLNFKVQF